MANIENYFLAYEYEDKAQKAELLGASDDMKEYGEWLVYQSENQKDVSLMFFDDVYYILENFYFRGKLEIGVLNIRFITPESAIKFALNNNIDKMLVEYYSQVMRG